MINVEESLIHDKNPKEFGNVFDTASIGLVDRRPDMKESGCNLQRAQSERIFFDYRQPIKKLLEFTVVVLELFSWHDAQQKGLEVLDLCGLTLRMTFKLTQHFILKSSRNF